MPVDAAPLGWVGRICATQAERMGGSMMRAREAGYTVIEFIVALTLLSLLILLMMPSLMGYQANAQVRSFGEQIVEQTRAAELAAVSTGQWTQYNVHDDSAPYSIQFLNSVGTVLSEVELPPTMHVTAACYKGKFEPQGTANEFCANPNATFNMICFDSNTPGNPLGFIVTVVVATGQVIGTTRGACS
jgi:Tfp pilus assembly protein FimT